MPEIHLNIHRVVLGGGPKSDVLFHLCIFFKSFQNCTINVCYFND